MKSENLSNRRRKVSGKLPCNMFYQSAHYRNASTTRYFIRKAHMKVQEGIAHRETSLCKVRREFIIAREYSLEPSLLCYRILFLR